MEQLSHDGMKADAGVSSAGVAMTRFINILEQISVGSKYPHNHL